MTVEYTPAGTGGWLALCASDRVLVLETADATLTTPLWAALRETGGLQSVLDLLARGGLAAMPQFALLDLRDVPRVIVRGGVTVTAQTSSPGDTESDEHRITGAGVTTWTEQLLPSAVSMLLAIDAAEPVPSVGPLPLVDGGAWVAAVNAQVTGDSSPTNSAASSATTASASDAPAPIAAASPTPAQTAPAAPVTEPDPEVTVVELPDPADLPEPEAEPDPESASESESVEPAQPSSYDYLFGDTMYRDVASAAVAPEAEDGSAENGSEENGAEEQRAAEAVTESGSGERVARSAEGEPQASVTAASDTVAAGDHDGQTVLTSDIAKLRAERKAKRAGRAAPSPAEASPAAPPAPTVVLTLPNGSRESLAQPVLVGRAPSVSQVSGGNIPRLVTVGTADQDISRTHARFVLEGGTVVVTDLHSRNGTMIVLPGKEPQKLRAGEPTAVIVGTVVDFGGGVTLTVEES